MSNNYKLFFDRKNIKILLLNLETDLYFSVVRQVHFFINLSLNIQ